MLQQTPTTIPSEVRDFTEWRRGREAYAVWVLNCDEDAAIQESFQSARAHLHGYLLEPYHRQPHITLFVCGFLVKEHRHNDDFTSPQLDAQIDALGKMNLAPFEIEVGGMNSFASAPFFEVRDPDQSIPRLRETLSKGAREFRTAPYRPHLTIGLYADVFPSESVLAQMATFSGTPVKWKVEQIALATYNAREIGGELSYKYHYRLNA